jgi:hypothetical protein
MFFKDGCPMVVLQTTMEYWLSITPADSFSEETAFFVRSLGVVSANVQFCGGGADLALPRCLPRPPQATSSPARVLVKKSSV